MTEAFSEIQETFDFLDDWEDRYRHVIELGKSYAALDPALRVDTLKVEGCASQVWLLPRLEDGRFSFQGASDALIVSGLIAILAALYNDTSLAEARKIDALAEFGALGFDQHLSAQRSNGLRAMIERIATYLATQ
ncbi:cysteine desulfurization protein SufE [Amylibacter marinus]|uniref:Cysteine desulfurization protein SufE n=1 Tax=Amylibacter marinus TaxID=1475483 RepID=A0ABQ5VSF5_9RHOB|nr:SufE family protein [Amylibacter marinus]GLQ34192.1 cysteine desulfurization protein SufE [Amylibacter marinus]